VFTDGCSNLTRPIIVLLIDDSHVQQACTDGLKPTVCMCSWFNCC